MSTVSTLDVVIRTLKEGNGDQETISALEAIRAKSEGTSAALAGTGEGMESLRLIGSRTSEQMLRLVGVNETVIRGLKLIELGHKAAASGVIVHTLAMGGLVAVVGGAVTLFRNYAAELDKATESEIQSAKDLNHVLSQRTAILQRISELRSREAILSSAEAGLAGARLGSEFSRVDLTGAARARALRVREIPLMGGSAFDAEREKARQASRFSTEEVDAEIGSVQSELAINQATQRDLSEQRKSAKDGKSIEALDAQLSKLNDTINQQADRLLVLARQRKQNLDLASQELRIAFAEIDAREKADTEAKEQRNLERKRTITEEIHGIARETFELEARARGVEDERVIRAAAYLQSVGRAADAQRLISAELEKQKVLQSQLTPAQQAGQGIVRQGRVDVEAVVDRQAFGDRGYARGLLTDLNSRIGTERNRLQGTTRDRGAVNDQLSAFVADLLGKSPDTARLLGVGAAPSGDKNQRAPEFEKLLKEVDLSRAKDDTNKKLQGVVDDLKKFLKENGDLHQATRNELSAAMARIAALGQRK